MASYTTNLNLLKKDPATDASDTFNIQTMLNENWDKLDAAMAAARSAEEYDAAGTYAVDDYCTHDGKLYKCTTAITAAEAWTAAHWAETSVGAELKAMLAALGGKATTTTLTVTVPVSWTASGGYYYQQVSVAGMLATDNPIADILPGSDNAANKLYAEAWGKVQSGEPADGAVTLWTTEAPTTAFPMQFKIIRTGNETGQGKCILAGHGSEGGQIATYSYTGSGTSGPSHPNTMTFGFKPKVVIILSETDFLSSSSTSYISTPVIFVADSNFTRTFYGQWSIRLEVVWNGNTLSWYKADGDEFDRSIDQLNVSGRKYNCVAFG